MQQFELELKVGDSLQIGNQIVTVIDIDGPELSVRIDPADGLLGSFPEEEASVSVSRSCSAESL